MTERHDRNDGRTGPKRREMNVRRNVGNAHETMQIYIRKKMCRQQQYICADEMYPIVKDLDQISFRIRYSLAG